MSHQAQQAREVLGDRLRELRVDAGLTGRALAALAGWQLSKVSKIEHGRQNASESDVRTWCRHCAADDQAADLVATTRAIKGMWLEWRRSLQGGIRIRQQRELGVYHRTKLYRVYEPSVIWGTLQTAEYAAAVFGQLAGFLEMSDVDIDAAVAKRLERQQYLYRGDRRFHVILGEQALYTNLGGSAVMRGQLDRLLATVSLPRLQLGIIPRTCFHRVWPGNSFIMFDDRTVMVETYSAEFSITQPREIALYAKAFGLLQSSAVYGRAVTDLISSAMVEWNRHE